MFRLEGVEVRFGDLAALGRRDLANGDAPTASAILLAALAEWRGRPYAEFEGEQWVDGEIAWSKLASLAEGAAIASDRLWR